MHLVLDTVRRRIVARHMKRMRTISVGSDQSHESKVDMNQLVAVQPNPVTICVPLSQKAYKVVGKITR